MAKKNPEPSFEDRLNAASAKAAAALSVFEVAAVDLDLAGQEKELVAIEIANKRDALFEEIDRLSRLETEALDASDKDYNTASKIRAFVGN